MATELFKLMGRIYIEMDDAETALSKFESLLNGAVTALQSIDTKLTTVNTTLNTMDTRLSDANAELGELDSKAGTANASLNTLDSNVEALNGSMNTMDTRVNDVVNELSQLNSNAKTAGDRLTTMNSTLSGFHNPFSSDGALAAGAIWLANIIEDLTYKVLDLSWEFLKIGINFNASAETYQASFKTMLGVTEKEAKEVYEKLRQFAIDTPYSMEGVADSAVRLFNAGYDVEGTLEMLEVLGNIANGDSAKMERLVKAWTDVKGYGRLRAQERNQFVENGVMIDQLLADYYQSQGMSISADEIMSRLEAKEVAEIDVLNALIMAQMEGGNFYNAMTNLMLTWSGQLEKTGDQLDQTAGAFTLPFFDELKDEVMPKLSGLLTELEMWSKDNSELLSDIASDLGSAATGALSSLLDLFTFLVEKKDTLLPILEAVGLAFAVTAAKQHPIIAAMGMLLTMASENPEAFDTLTEGLSNLAKEGLGALETGLTKLIDFWNQNQGAFKLMTAILGGLALVTGHPVAGIALLMASELSGTEGLEEVYKNEDGSYRTNILFPGVTKQMNDSSPVDKEAGRYHYFSETARSVAESLWDMQRMGLTGQDVSGFESLMAQAYAEFGKIATELGVADTDYAVTSLLTDLVNQMMTLDKSTENLPDDWFYDPDKAVQPTDWNLHYLDPATNPTIGNTNLPALIASVQTLTTAVQGMTGEIPGALADAVGNITVNCYVTTGDVKLDSGTVVGELSPMLDLKLGQIASQSNWG